MEYNKNKTIQITFTIRESLYHKFKTLCRAEKKMPATVIKEYIRDYVERRTMEMYGNNNRKDDGIL